MSILDQLASAQGRRDEKPNIALAEQLASTGDPNSVALLVEQLHGKSRAIAHDCIKVLYELGARRPDLIAPYVAAFVKTIQDGDNRLVWGGMTALGAIVTIDAGAVAPYVQTILHATERGSVITQDWGIRVLAATPSNRADILAVLRVRLPSLKESAAARVKKVIKRIEAKEHPALKKDTRLDL